MNFFLYLVLCVIGFFVVLHIIVLLLDQKVKYINRNFELPYNKDYFAIWNDQKEVPCINCKTFIPRYQTIITRNGFYCRKCGIR